MPRRDAPHGTRAATAHSPADPSSRRRGLSALALEEPDWARVALALTTPEPACLSAPGEGLLAWRLGPDDVVCYTRRAGLLPTPFEQAVTGEDDRASTGLERWRLPRQVNLLPATALAGRQGGLRRSPPAEGAALVTAWEDNGARTLLDLVRLSSVAIDAPPVAGGLALGDAVAELSTRRWSDLDELVIVGFERPLEALEHTRFLRDVAGAEHLVRSRLRRREPLCPAPGLCIVVVPGFPGSGRRGALSTLISLVEQLPGACLLCCDPSAPVRAVWRFESSDEATEVEVRSRGNTVATLRRQGDAGQGRAGRPGAAAVSARPAPQRPSGRGESPAGVRIAILGHLSVTGAQSDISHRPKASELLVYLALHPDGVTGEALMAAVWSDRRVPVQSFSNRLSEIRRALGRGPDGSARLVRHRGRHYLGLDVSCDWTDFERLTGPGTGPDEWMQALRLVRGRPFHNMAFGDWVALEGFAATMERSLLDTVMRTSETLLEAGDFVGADWAARRGIVVAPWDERPYRQLMRSAYLAGSRKGIDAALQALARALDLRDDPLRGVHPLTADLYRNLVG